ncbi:MAG: AI-2E family transporter [Planctomycetia bacterium]
MTNSEGRTATAAIVVLAVVAVGAAFTVLGPVLKPFLLAVFLYYVTQFGAQTLERLGLGRRAAYLGLLLLAMLATNLAGQLIYRESRAFLRSWPRYEARITNLITDLPQLSVLMPKPAALAPGAAADAAGSAPTPVADAADRQPSDEEAPPTSDEGEPQTADGEKPPARHADTARSSMLVSFFQEASKASLDYVFKHSLDFAEVFALVFVYLIFLFVGSRKLPGKIRKAFPGEQGERILLIGAGITESMERFMAVKTIVGIGMAVTAGLVMFAFRLDHWLLWAFLFFASNYITYLGSIAACVPPILLGFVALSGPLQAVAMAVILIVNRLVWIDYVEVRMSGRQLNLDPTLMFLWLSYWGWVWGVLGLLLAYPMLAAVKIVLAHVRGSEGWAVLLSEE